MDGRRPAERGQGVVEFAVIFPLFVILIFVMIDGGLLMGRYNQVNHAAQEGARLAATGATSGQVATHVRAQSIDVLSGVPATCSGAASERICVQWYDGPGGEQFGRVGSLVRVTVRYDYGFVTPINNDIFNSAGMPEEFDVDACAVATLERRAPAGISSSGDADDAEC